MHYVHVAAHFKSVAAVDQRDVIGELGAALDAVHGGVRFAAEIGEAGNVYADVGAAGQFGKSEVQTAARVLETEFVESGVAENGVMLRDDGKVARLVHACASAGVLPKDLILRGGLNAGHQGRRNAHAQKRGVAIAPALIEAR